MGEEDEGRPQEGIGWIEIVQEDYVLLFNPEYASNGEMHLWKR